MFIITADLEQKHRVNCRFNNTKDDNETGKNTYACNNSFFFLAWKNLLKQNGGEEKLVGLIPAWEGFEVERLVIAAVVALDQQFKRDR